MLTAIICDENDNVKVVRTLCNDDFRAYVHLFATQMEKSVLKQSLYKSGIDECESVSIKLPERSTDNAIITIENEEDGNEEENKRVIISNAVNEINKILDTLNDATFYDIIDPKKDLNGKGYTIFTSRIFK